VATFLATYDFLLVSMVLAAVLALTLYLQLMAGQLSEIGRASCRERV